MGSLGWWAFPLLRPNLVRLGRFIREKERERLKRQQRRAA